MNTERLAELARFLLDANGRRQLQGKLERLRDALNNLAGNPGNSDYQRQVAEEIDTLESELREFDSELTPARRQAIADIGGEPFFTVALANGIRAEIATNAISPSVVGDRVGQLTQGRQNFLQLLTDAWNALTNLGAAGEPLEPGTAEIGFLIPRPIFENTLAGLADEFRQINRICGVFSELTTGAVEPVEVHQISTTDPLIFLGLPPLTIAALGAAITWGLDTWKKLLEIKQLQDKVKAAGLPDEVTDRMKEHIQKTVDAAIEEKVAALLEQHPPKDQGRANEVRNGLRFALQALMQKIEQGVVVEIRALPPPVDVSEDDRVQATFAEINATAKALEFPKLTGERVLQLKGPDAEPA